MGFDLGALPVFPWDLLEPYKAQAAAHPGGLIDLSVGTPVDPTPPVLQQALVAAADSPGYPATIGSPALRGAIVHHYEQARGVTGLTPDGVLPTLGSKEMVALLPSLLGLGPGDVVVHPHIAYPTYDLGARLAGATPWPCAHLDGLPPDVAARVKLVWVNSPANPHGAVLGVDELTAVVAWARQHGAVVAADECYAALPWAEPWVTQGVPSLLDPRATGGDLAGLLALYSLSKQSNAAGYRAAWVAGDPALIKRLAAVRKHMGMMMPGPVQAAAVAALADGAHVAAQRQLYGRRRRVLAAALTEAGLAIEGSQAGLYLWVTTADRQDAWATVAALADLGILVAPGTFYGEAGAQHVRIALTGSDQQIAEAAARLAP
ncbi:MAG: succinyldiaminopimelate transaminase [Bifidobacteriaceae bacterium]|jgi:succinyldiaminopimelate transaminase|nr:succinyldiaminopimelate transaminase [Bifidobacteriaceae bacterium]